MWRKGLDGARQLAWQLCWGSWAPQVKAPLPPPQPAGWTMGLLCLLFRAGGARRALARAVAGGAGSVREGVWQEVRRGGSRLTGPIEARFDPFQGHLPPRGAWPRVCGGDGAPTGGGGPIPRSSRAPGGLRQPGKLTASEGRGVRLCRGTSFG